MRRNRIVFWQGESSPHQSSYLRALADLLPGTTIIGVFEDLLEKERLDLGWAPADLGPIEAIVSPNHEEIVRLASHDSENTVHIFSGFRLSITRRAMPICARTKAVIGLLSEAREWQGWLGKLRILHSYVAERRYRSRIDFVLAIGHRGVRWYKICGYTDNRIFPWGYFVENATPIHCYGNEEINPADVVISFVGRCIPCKGIDTLLEALSRSRSKNWWLQIIGDGPQRQKLEGLSEILGVAKRVSFMGIRENAVVRNILGRTDFLVFPSKCDGWGAVVNEALMSGVPVVCSEYCGAADLVRASGYGAIFQTGSVEDLARVLDKWIERGPLTDAYRDKIRAWSKCIDGDAAAQYLIEVLDYVDDNRERPVAPWFRDQSEAAKRLGASHGIR